MNAKEKSYINRMEETPEEKELCLKNAWGKAYAKRMEQTPEKKEVHLNKKQRPKGCKKHQRKMNVITKKAQKKRETNATQKNL